MASKQSLVAIAVGLSVGWLLWTDGATIGTTSTFGILSYLFVRVVLSWIHRTGISYSRGRQYDASCPGCGQSINRQPQDWILTCKRCGWKPGLPALRWLNYSVPSRQLRRSIGVSRAVVAFLAIGLIVTGAAGGVTMSDVTRLSGLGSPSEAGDMPGGITESTPTESAPTATETGDFADILGELDFDGDRLSNSSENSEVYSGAGSMHKDLYVRVLISSNVGALPLGWQSVVKEEFASMPVENPDGEHGIDVHFVTVRRLDTEVVASGGNQTLEQVRDQVPPPSSDIPCRDLHTVVLTTWSNSEYAGWAHTPGVLSVVDTTYPEIEAKRDVLTSIIIHELLHNIVGERLDPFDPQTESNIHTTEGWLRGEADSVGADRFMSEPVTELLSESGFAPIGEYTPYCGEI